LLAAIIGAQGRQASDGAVGHAKDYVTNDLAIRRL
jgi:hypothetical protein